MRDRILHQLQQLEKTEGITILHAVESGSRAWGFPSPDSDYDVRFIYIRSCEAYLRLEKRPGCAGASHRRGAGYQRLGFG